MLGFLGVRSLWARSLPIIALLVAFVVVSVSTDPDTAGNSDVGGTLPPLVVHFLDVGQGDAVLLQGEDFTILVDAGRHDRSDVVPHLKRVNVETIDLFIGTHPHADHIGQCAPVLREFPVVEVWMSGDEHSTLTFERCLDAILQTDAGYREPRAGDVFQVGSARIEIVHPDELTGSFNNNSLVVRLVYGDVAFLLAGDAEAEAEGAILRRGHELTAQVLKLGHHGSRTSSTTEFLQAIQPDIAVYSAGRNNSYGHPHAETLHATAALGIPVYGTDVFGTIRVTTDGRSYVVMTERDITDDASSVKPANGSDGPVGTNDADDAGQTDSDQARS